MLSRRERIIGITAGAIVTALALDQVMVTPLLARLEDADTRAALAGQELTRAEEVFSNDLRARRRWKELGGDALAADAPAAEGQVLNRVRQWAQEAGLSLTSLKPERDEPVSGFRRVTVRATATGGMEQVGRFLFAVERADVPLRIADVQIASRREGTDDLSLQVALTTIYLPRPAPAASPALPTSPTSQAPGAPARATEVRR